jgi:polyisoprenoid-binding protein YceI
VSSAARDNVSDAGKEGGSALTINAGTSRLRIKTFAGGPFAALGHDLTFAVPIHKGTITLDAGKGTGSVEVRIRAEAITLEGDRSEKDRREIEGTLKDRVLEVSQHAEIVYEAAGATVTKAGSGYDVEVAGSLTLHGVTHRFPLRARVNMMGTVLRAFGEFALRMSDYRIEQVTVAGGALKVKDEIKATFDVAARP